MTLIRPELAPELRPDEPVALSDDVIVALGLPSEASEGDVLAAIEKLSERRQRAARRIVEFVIARGRVRRTQRAWAEAFAARDPDAFWRYLELAPPDGFPTALAELEALVQERGEAIPRAAALERVAFDHPELVDEVRRELARLARRRTRRARAHTNGGTER